MLRIISILCFLVLTMNGCSQGRIIQDTSIISSMSLGLEFSEPQIHEYEDRKIIELYRGNSWVLAKSFPFGYLDIFRNEGGQIAAYPISLPLQFRKDSYPLWAGEGKSGDIYIVTYDVLKNSPSGRTLSGVHEGLSVYRVSPKGGLNLIADNVALGGIDTQIYGVSRESGIDICGDNTCYSVGDNSKVVRWDTDFLSSDEFVEINFSSGGVAAIVRRKHDDRLQGGLSDDYSKYEIVTFSQNGLKQRKGLDGGVPYALKWDGSTVLYRKATTKADYANVFLFDLLKMRFHGLLDFGSNNLEGRVAWSQVYYINGLLSLLKGYGPDVSGEVKKNIEERVKSELSLIAELCEDEYPGFDVKRYSIDRENVLFALHLGRVLDLFGRAGFVINNNQKIQLCKIKIKSELESLDKTVEKVSRLPDGAGMAMRYRYGYPFWADGANVPFNYISGYIAGLLSFDRSDADVHVAVRLSEPLVSELVGNKYPQLWRYWQGIGDAGWSISDRVSLNTPDYVGNRKSMAHVTYRTMDAYALSKINQFDPSAVSDDLVNYLRSLVQTGYLLPSLNEVFTDNGGGPVLMNPQVVNRYARSAYAYELESQIWALGQLAQASSIQ